MFILACDHEKTEVTVKTQSPSTEVKPEEVKMASNRQENQTQMSKASINNSFPLDFCFD